MSEKLNTIAGKQNDFATRFMGGGTIAAGVAGGASILTLDPPAGQRVRLTHLSTGDALEQVGISVVFGATTVIGGAVNGSNPSQPDRFSIGSYQEYGVGVDPPSMNHTYWTGATDEALTIVKDAGNTTQIIYYGYEFGE